MSSYDVVIDLCRKHGIAPTSLEKELGFGRGSIGKMRTSKMTYERLQKIADYFSVDVSYIVTGESSEKESTSGEKYYFDDSTAETAQMLFENNDLRLLFDAAKDSRPADLQLAADLLRRLKGEGIDE